MELGSRLSQALLTHRCGRVRAAEHAPRGPLRLLERGHGLADIVERGAFDGAEHQRVIHPHLRPPDVQSSSLPEQPTAALAGDVAALARERALRNPGLFSADGLFAPTEEPDFEFDGDGELDELTSADFGEDPYLHVDT